MIPKNERIFLKGRESELIGFSLFSTHRRKVPFKSLHKHPKKLYFVLFDALNQKKIHYPAYVCLTFFSCLSMSLWMSGGILIQGDLKKACHFQNVFFEAYHLGMTMTIDKNIQKTFFLVQSKVTSWSIIISPVS